MTGGSPPVPLPAPTEEDALAPYDRPPPSARGASPPEAVVTACIESGHDALLLDHGELPPEFFDLSSGVAGEMVGRLGLYGLRMAVVVPDPAAHSAAFRDFAREANRGRAFRFFPTHGEAAAWLESA